MIANQIVCQNENLLKIVLSYMNVKDLASTTQVNKTFYKISNVFNDYWRNACCSYFSSPYEQHR